MPDQLETDFIGLPIPKLKFTDIEGVATHTEAYPDSIVVVTFAGREGAEDMSSWMNQAGTIIGRTLPEVPIAFLGFADLREVPKLMRRLVKPMLKLANKQFKVNLASSYPRRKPSHHFTADWDGGHKRAFGLPAESTYDALVFHKGQMVGHIDENTVNQVTTFVGLIEDISKQEKIAVH